MKKVFIKEARTELGTVRFIENDMGAHIDAYWGSKRGWEEIPENINDFNHFISWDQVVHIDHGYDESKPEEELDIDDVKGAARFRGGECRSITMKKGDWKGKLNFRCALGHEFEASPRLILEGGHWCPECERKSWNYAARAKVDPFFAQVWYPLHDRNEKEQEYKKEVTELEI